MTTFVDGVCMCNLCAYLYAGVKSPSGYRVDPATVSDVTALSRHAAAAYVRRRAGLGRAESAVQDRTSDTKGGPARSLAGGRVVVSQSAQREHEPAHPEALWMVLV